MTSMRLAIALAALVALAASTSWARADDVATALDELKQGYGLKQTGRCHDAAPHFARSFELDPKPKAALNLADCEAQMGNLVDARGHAAEGLRLAHEENNAELSGVANEQLAALEKRLPRLTIKLARGAPPASTVTRDGVAAGNVTSVGPSVGVNPGAHSIQVTAPGHAAGRFSVTLAEGDREEIEVAPGARLDAGADVERGRGQPTWRLLTYAALGVGAVGLTVGIATGIAAGSKHGALLRQCDTQGNCPSSAQGDLDGFRSLRTWSTAGYVVGLLGVAGGAALWLFPPHPSSAGGASAHVWLSPTAAGFGARF